MKVMLVLGMLAATMISGASDAGSEPVETLFAGYGFPAAPGLKHLCGESVAGKEMHITWDAFVSKATVGESIAFYRKKLGDAGMEGNSNGATWRLPTGAQQPERVLTVSATTAEGPHRKCDNEALAKAKSVVMVSRAAR